jgi:hypothetical protein
MKRLISLLLVLVVLLGGAYGGLWYYGCMRLEAKLSKTEFNVAFGPDKAVTMAMKMERGPLRYTGWQRGRVGVEFDVKSIASISLVKVPQQAQPQVSTCAFSAGEKPMVARVTVPLWGKSLALEVDPLNEARWEMKVNDQSFAMLQSHETYRVNFVFRGPQLALAREKQVDAMIADPKRIVEDLAGVGIEFKGKTLNALDKAVVMEGAVNGGGLWWGIGADGMLTVRSDIDMEANYGPGFASWMGMMPAGSASLDPSAQEILQSFQKIQQLLMAQSSFVTKGAVQLTLPANRVGLREKAAEVDSGFPVPPFEVKFEEFKFRLPFILSGMTSVDGTIGFMVKEAKPIALDITQETEAVDLQKAADSIIKVVLESPQFKGRTIDTSRVAPSSLVSFKELESDQGSFVLLRSSIEALSRAYFGQKGRFALNVNVKTSSGNANVFELMGAVATWATSLKLGNGFGWELKGSADGAKSWKTDVAIYELSKLLREFRAPLMLFGARSGLATFFQSNDSSESVQGEALQKQKQFLTFLFSDELFEDLLAALGRVLRVVDQTPDSTSDLNFLLEGSGSDLQINGKSAQELQQAISSVAMQEVQALEAKFKPQLAVLQAAQQVEAEPESEQEENTDDVQWQEAPTEEGDASGEVIQ